MDVDGEGSRESCRGEEASSLLDKTCREIVAQTRELEKETEKGTNSNGAESKPEAEMYPLFVSYRYFLLGPELLNRVIPEHKENPHFEFNESASILALDDKLEKAKAEESHEHKLISATPATSPRAESPNPSASTKPDMPGMKTKKAAAKFTNRPKTSMFMPSKRPGMTARGGRQIPVSRARRLY